MQMAMFMAKMIIRGLADLDKIKNKKLKEQVIECLKEMGYFDEQEDENE